MPQMQKQTVTKLIHNLYLLKLYF